jgi:hypothetical protein
VQHGHLPGESGRSIITAVPEIRERFPAAVICSVGATVSIAAGEHFGLQWQKLLVFSADLPWISR